MLAMVDVYFAETAHIPLLVLQHFDLQSSVFWHVPGVLIKPHGMN